MKLQSILLGRAVRLVKTYQPLGGTYLPAAVKALQERYEFVQVPNLLLELSGTQGITFKHGKFNIPHNGSHKDIVIGSLTIQEGNITVDTASDTDHADSVIDDLLEFGKERGLTVSPLPPARTFVSTLEVSLAKDFSVYYSPTEMLKHQLTAYCEGYGYKAVPFELQGVTFFIDKTLSFPPPLHLLQPFTIQRRDGVPYSSTIYFSQAPLKTKDHLALLEKLESFG